MDKPSMKAFLRGLSKDITVDIRVPFSEVSLVDIAGLFQSGTLRASVTMRQE